ncbi:MAG: methyltransferase domain-containing protein [Rhodoferax sp.]
MTGILSSKNDLDALYSDIEQYYTQKVSRHGPTPLGVDWPCQPTQELRFVQLLRLCDFETPFSLNDIGCGYGAMLAFLAQRHRRKTVDYLGVDLSSAMVAEAYQLWCKRRNTEFVVANTSPRVADYSVASGIFNVKLNQPDALWTLFIKETLTMMRATSRRGFAVNFLAPLTTGAPGEPELYRAPSTLWGRYCEQEFGAAVEVLGSYGMREYTLLVRTSQPAGVTASSTSSTGPVRSTRLVRTPSPRSGQSIVPLH